MRRIVLALSFLLAYTASAFAQSGCSTIVTGAVLTAAQWNACFAAKQNVLGFTPLSLNGGIMTGRLVTAASTTTAAGFNIPAGTAPTSPVDGDIWTTTAGVFARINGSTIGLGGGTVLLANGSVGAPSLAFSSDTDTGLYRIGSNNIGIAVGGVKIVDISSTTISATQRFLSALSSNGTFDGFIVINNNVGSLANAAFRAVSDVGVVEFGSYSNASSLAGDSFINVAGAFGLRIYTNGAERIKVSGAGLTTIDNDFSVLGTTTVANINLTGPILVTSNSSTCIDAGPNGITNPTFQVDCSTGSAVTGVKVTSNIAGSGSQIAALSSNTNDSLSVLAKGTGTVQIGTGSQQVTIGGTAGTIALRFINDNLTGFGSRAPLETNNYANSQETMRWAQSVVTSFATFRANSNLVANATQTIASGASVAWNDFEVASHTTTLTGTTTITSPFAKSVFFGGTLTNASAVTVNNAAAVFIDAAPVAAGSVTIGAGWSLFINSGRALFGGGLTTNIGSTIMVPTQTIVSAGAAVWSDLELSDSTMTLTGTTTVNALARAYIGGGFITDSSSVTVTSATTLYVAAPPAAAGSVTITNPWAFRLGAGNMGVPASGYVNFGASGSSSSGTGGYGFRDNSGTMEFKNSGGSWAAFGGGASGAQLEFGATFSGPTLSSTTYYGSGAASGTNALVQTPVTRSGTLRNLYFTTKGTQSGTGNMVVTVRVNGSGTGITVTVAAGAVAATVSDTTHTASVSAGDLIAVEVVNNATATGALFQAAVELD